MAMDTMNSLIKIILLQFLFGLTLSNLVCLNTENCSCQKNANQEEIEVLCNSSFVKANLIESLIEVHCGSDHIQWEKSFDQINITKLNFKYCHLNTGIHQIMTSLGINVIQSLQLMYMKTNSSLKSFFLSNLENVKQLDIRSTKLMLTNDSFQGTPDLTSLLLRENNIEEVPKGIFKHLMNLQVLDLGNNKISKIDNDLFANIPLKTLILDSNYLTTLSLNAPTLKRLEVSNNRLTSISVENLNNLIYLSLNKNILVTMTDQPFKNTSLETIKYNYSNFTIPHQFLTNLNRLLMVQLKFLNLEYVPENMIWNSPNITELSLASNHLKELPVRFFQDSRKMKVLDLSNNKIENINSDLLAPLEELIKLDLSNNRIVQFNSYGLKYLEDLNLEKNNIIHIKQEALNFPKLKTLKLAHNKISNLISEYSFSFQYLVSVESIDLSDNSLSGFVSNWISLIKLSYVNLERNNFTFLATDDINYIHGLARTNLNSNPLQIIDLSNLENYAKLQSLENSWNTRTLMVSSNNMICDCRNYELARYINNKMPKNVKEFLQIKQNLTCNNGTRFENLNMYSLTCKWEFVSNQNKTICPECECSYRPYDNSAIMDCSSRNLKSAPRVTISSENINYTEVDLSNNFITKLPDYTHLNIGKLNVGYNNLTTINTTQLPKNLIELNVQHNNLIMISETTPNITLTKLKQLTMSGNPWACNCEAKNTINFIHKYSSKITDLAKITCPSSTPLNIMSMEEICPINNFKFLVTAVAVAIFIGLILVIVLHLCTSYKNVIKMWLFYLNLTCIVSEESIDEDKMYDAFISFSHKDEELVAKHLVPGLEEGSKPFKLCLHYRDWVPGDWIPAQIARSVDQSRRTIIVLSKNYLDSIWGLTEFRTAYSSALNERRNRIIVILYGNISTEDLDKELQSYLSMNTYIKWGDYWFWEKLLYALPHRAELKHKTKIIVPDKLNPLQLT